MTNDKDKKPTQTPLKKVYLRSIENEKKLKAYLDKNGNKQQ
jgi:hypothetical protein